MHSSSQPREAVLPHDPVDDGRGKHPASAEAREQLAITGVAKVQPGAGENGEQDGVGPVDKARQTHQGHERC